MSERLTVALALDDSLDRPDGVQQHVLTLGRWLVGHGHDVHYLAPSTSRRDLPNLHVIGGSVSVRANGNVLRTPTWPRTRDLDSVLRSVRPDILHVAMPCSPLLGGRLAARAARTTAVVGTFHIVPATWGIGAGARVLGLGQRRQIDRFDRFLAVSEPAQRFALKAFGVGAEIVANPVDVSAFSPRPFAPREHGPVRVVFLGRLVERKGPGHLLRAVAEMRRRRFARTPFEVVVAGSGPLAGRLRAEARELGVSDVVTFPGFIAEGAKAALLATADVVVLPSVAGESFGISVVEALASSRGVVLAGDNAGYREVMGELSDQLVPPRDARVFAKRLGSWIDAPDRRDDVVTEQRARARAFDVERVGPRVLASYERARTTRRSRIALGRLVVSVPVGLTVLREPGLQAVRVPQGGASAAQVWRSVARMAAVGDPVIIDLTGLVDLGPAAARTAQALVDACAAAGLAVAVHSPDRRRSDGRPVPTATD